ncbi:hypothetical protein GH5_03097 [Leishmania sp. Ghana 2012 LV757]|uniref:hypothetical protein n=1 Tax=Leishmania sp. Ghana 2012 LV757 TaxID=2803181 RepID=UPI001B5A8D12|nr:hypothetical protein GH5_03097 [Leishmania sp. Ghana 2012 LV757]
MNGKGVEDAIYVNFFGLDGQAAVLACDMYGILPENLLYMPKQAYIQTGDESEQILLVRYTMCERSRQGTFRTLLGAKSKLIEQGKVEALWTERCRTLRDVASCPRFTQTQLEEAAATLDTDSESDTERQVDERGMLKPPPPLRCALSVASVGPGDQATVEADRTKDKELCVTATDTPYCGRRDTDTPSPQRVQASSDAGVGAKRVAQRLHSSHTPCSLVKLAAPPLSRKLPSQPPTIPTAYFPRTRETLTVEEQELSMTQKVLCRYSRKAARRLRAREHERYSGPSSPSRSTSLPPLISSPSQCTATTRLLQSARLRNHRERVALHRVAEVNMRSLAERCEQARTIDDEMEAIPTLGTLEHMLRYQKSIGVTPDFEDRIQTRIEREESRAAVQLETRQTECERAYAIEEKEQRAEEVVKRGRDEKKGISAEVERTRRLITHWKGEAALRQREAHLGSLLGRSAERHAKADGCIEMKRAAANQLRYEHDQQEVHRRQLRDTVYDMMIRINASPTEVKNEDINAVA